MDLLTQGVLGAAMAQSGSREDDMRLAAGVGFGAGLLADADALIYSAQDTLLTIEYHRHFTHSLLFIPVGALLASLILWPFLRKRISFGWLYLYSLLGYSMSGLIDACTSYGTHLLWPFSDERSAFNLVAIVDPIFTVILISAVFMAYRHYRRKAVLVGLALAACYLGVAFLQLQRAESASMELAQERGHTPVRLLAKPTFGNILLWRTIYEHNGSFYVDAVRVGTGIKYYEGESIKRYQSLPTPMTVLDQDIQRFNTFSDGYIALQPLNYNSLHDVRYSIQPDGLAPLWGIEFDPAQPGSHAKFTVYRNLTRANRQRFLAMLLGQDVEPL